MVVIDFLLLLTHWRWMMTIGKYTFIVTSKVKFAPSCLSFPWFQAMRASCTSPCLPYSYYFDSITNLFDFLFLQTFLSLLLDNLMIWVFLFQLKFRGVVRIFELVLCSMIPFPPLGPLSCSWVYALLRQPLSSYGLFHCGLWAIACPCSCPAIVKLEVNTWVWFPSEFPGGWKKVVWLWSFDSPTWWIRRLVCAHTWGMHSTSSIQWALVPWSLEHWRGSSPLRRSCR